MARLVLTLPMESLRQVLGLESGLVLPTGPCIHWAQSSSSQDMDTAESKTLDD